MSEIQQFLTGKEVIELHKKVYNLISKRWHETIYGVGDYEPLEDPAPEYVGVQIKDILIRFPDCEYEKSDIDPTKGSAEIVLDKGVLMLDFENDVCIKSYILCNSELDKMSDDKITSTHTLKELEKIFVLLYNQYKDPSFKLSLITYHRSTRKNIRKFNRNYWAATGNLD
ncbi:MAG: hypothetical protein LIP04_12000 [Tannerellaceae bacterium]|nr:hypothetical protein [Tannerellaceae bacterium]